MPPPLLDPESILDTSVARETEEVDPFSSSNSGPRDEKSLFFSLNGSIKALNESLSSLLANHHKHREVIVAMDKFLMRSEAERCNPRLNAVFMSTLRGILNDEQLFLAAAPLFVQLMALRGLLKKKQSCKEERFENGINFYGMKCWVSFFISFVKNKKRLERK
ncbi:hypothetical protein C3747_100g73 [Trypanosoma cruzi]|uniref:Uncharacterized protein n=1 Tax=Trypanosoma cruzi TaxID=5693 RepID=A0A2V2WG36_TRYCR|nr:hypothetical protein C3747_100g73 [Trypanosoma cruzi]